MSRRFEKYLKEMNARVDKRKNVYRGETSQEKLKIWKKRKLPQHIKKIFRFLTIPAAIIFLMNNNKIRPEYNMTLQKKLWLGFRMWRNTEKVFTGTSFRAHLLMARKLLELSPDIPGAIVECGSFKGGSATNLSLVCKIIGRKLIIYDSFEGLPDTGEETDAHFHEGKAGIFDGSLEEVKGNISQYGCIDVCEFNKGWFKDTLPQHHEKIVAMFLDVDFQSSLHDCISNLWPHLHPQGYVFIDEYVHPDYCSLFYSEKYWQKYFNRVPPGLIGAGSGIPLGEFYYGPADKKGPIESMTSIAYTRKNFESVWLYYPDEEMAPQQKRHL